MIGKIARLVRNNGWYLAAVIVLQEVQIRLHSAFLARRLGVRKLRIEPGSRLRGLRHISVGENLGAGRGLWLEAITFHRGRSYDPQIVIGDNVWMSNSVTITATTSVHIGSGVLIASKVLITDHQHGNYQDNHQDDISDPSIPPAKRRLTAGRKVSIGDNVWLGDGVVVMPDVSIGEGSIIGANSVVTRNIAAFTIAAGAPARPLKKYDPERRVWRTVVPLSSAKQESAKEEECGARHQRA